MKNQTELICKNCGLIQPQDEAVIKKQPLPSGGYHETVYCGVCGSYIKHLPHTIPTFHFGKYKGHRIPDIAISDPSYLHWLRQQNIKPSMVAAIDRALQGVNHV